MTKETIQQTVDDIIGATWTQYLYNDLHVYIGAEVFMVVTQQVLPRHACVLTKLMQPQDTTTGLTL